MSRPRLLVVGMGMVGTAVRSSAWTSKFDVVTASRKTAGALPLDLASDESVNSFFDGQAPFDAVVNCAAEANVDACERDPQAGRQINALGVKRLSRRCRKAGTALLHIGTDYVFDGRGTRPYREEDAAGPCSVYGMTKLEGEHYAVGDPEGVSPEVSAVIRSTWIFGGFRADFVNGLLDRLDRGETPPVIDEQVASPTYSADLADAIGQVIEKALLPARRTHRTLRRIFHCVNQGAATRYSMAARMAAQRGVGTVLPKAVRQDISGWIAVRPRYTVLDTSRIAEECGVRMRSWEEALDAYLRLRTSRRASAEENSSRL